MLTTNNVDRPLEIILTIPVKTYDIDFAGIVSNIVYIKWLEDLRLKFLEENLPINQQIEQGYAPIISGTEIEYKRPIKLIDQVMGRLWLASLGRLKWTVQAEILSNNELAAVAMQKGAFVNLQNGRLIPVPAGLQQKYSQSHQT
ncbi:thioesterase family protein [Nostoc sp. TCL26-01]|uniref:acyl-CoA thioesterase n=1 Tax=Nostoc sp. TCL26-01 TaxID=2576904 RepID=UPI0015C0954D|nr:thioesterase family protein [Nostoc sp. TCL26-01]QLE55343.1 acyl-CoA thioesterase [Nostoc sp. TCL26-01]